MEKLHNQYVKIAPLEHKSFLPSESSVYQEIGIVLAKDEVISGLEVGDRVIFDRFLAFKIPIEGKDEFDWYVKYTEILSSSDAVKPIPEISMP